MTQLILQNLTKMLRSTSSVSVRFFFCFLKFLFWAQAITQFCSKPRLKFDQLKTKYDLIVNLDNMGIVVHMCRCFSIIMRFFFLSLSIFLIPKLVFVYFERNKEIFIKLSTSVNTQQLFHSQTRNLGLSSMIQKTNECKHFLWWSIVSEWVSLMVGRRWQIE